jgi:hypothetical protein
MNDDAPIAHGWQKKGMFDEPRLSEVVKIYEELGFEVRIELFEPNQGTDCAACMRASADRYKIVYTRQKT